MKRSTISLGMVILISTLLISACSGITVQIPGLTSQAQAANANSEQAPALAAPAAPAAAAPAAAPAPATSKAAQAAAQAVQSPNGAELLAAYQQTLENVYQQVGPSVVNIRVVEAQSAATSDSNQLPAIPGFPFFNNPNGGQNSPNSPQSPNIPSAQALGSGFVWDQDGHIITNNHVISGAQKIEVTFSDGRSYPATVVGADPDSDLAVLKVDVPASQLTPVKIADSNQVKVGQMAIAIGNPFGLEGTMTVGIVSALGRTLPAGESQSNGLGNSPTYSIPDIIQTDAPINPGNSGGVLLNSNGELIGVTAAIESTSNANAGIGFVIPSAIVKQVVPVLISSGKFEHPWIGISGITLSSDLASAMNLSSDQRGALVEDIMQNSPAEKAGLQGSSKSVTIDGRDINVGGDVITAVDGNPINTMEDLIAYLASSTTIGQKLN
ncbi:MAG: putative family peptidase, partial [Chloroflexi bacterium]|nr:putative family peptidase [Chloroflexota bacterium]